MKVFGMKKRIRLPMNLRIFLVFSVLLVLSIFVLSAVMIRLSERNMLEQSNRRIASILDLSVGQLDQQMTQFEDKLLDMMVDQDMYQIMSRIREGAPTNSAQSVALHQILISHLIDDDSFASIDVLYNTYSFSARMSGTIHYDALRSHDTWQSIQQAQGSPVWLSTDECRAITGSDDYICLARVLNMTDLLHFKQAFNQDSDKPVALICFSTNLLTRNLINNLNIQGAEYAFIDPAGGMIQISERKESSIDQINRWAVGKNGFGQDGNLLYYYSRSPHTGWTHLICFDQDILVGDMMSEMRKAMLRTLSVVLPVMLLITAVFSLALSKRVKKLTHAVRQIENGAFGYRVELDSSDEMGYLAEQFNQMSQSIQRLVEENLQVHIREKDTEIMSLTIQFNPHYLYNTLNAIYWVALNGDSREAAHMLHDLAQMMRYTSDQKQECTLLKDDIEWLHRYLYLMEARYGDLYTVDWKIQSGLEEMRVPKLFLQPLVENSIIHGFKNMEIGGNIVISGYETDDCLEFSVLDNGCGIPEETRETLLNPTDTSHTGLANVHRRIQLIYGEQFGLEVVSPSGGGTQIIARIAKESAEM